MSVKSMDANTVKLGKSGVVYIIKLQIQLLIMAAIFFTAAGSLHVKRGWIYFGIAAVTYVVSSIILIKSSPELLNERAKSRDNTKSRDKILVSLYLFIGFIGTHIVAGLDIGRFEWSELPIIYLIPGAVLYIASTAFGIWAMIVNKHFETTIRIQEDREHKVVKDGPYKIVRHPGYLSVLITWSSVPLMIGSLYAFFCTAAVFIIMIIRTAYEDKTLQKELPGYSQYAKEVKSRLVPGIW